MSGCDRRQFLQAAGAAVLAAAALPASVRCATQPKREGGLNVLFLMTDEQHHRSLSITGNPYIQTPNIDRIAREGALFRNATCVTPYCSPSRASIITGVYPHTHGIVSNVGDSGPANTGQPPLRQNAFANTETILHRQGYATAFRGKWHLGDLGDFDCYESFDYGAKTSREYQAFLNEKSPIANPEAFLNERFIINPGVRREVGTYYGRPVEMIPAMQRAARAFATPNCPIGYVATIGRTVIPPELLPETQITGQVLDLIEKNAGNNFMITASWIPPHDLWVIPDPYYSMVDRKKIELTGSRDLPPWDRQSASKRLGDLAGDEGLREYAAIYHGMVKYIDDQVGLILKKLDELGLAGNTLVIYTTDHGDMVGAHGCIGKSITGCYDDLVRIPLMMRLPGRIKPGTVIDQPVSQIDYMPTILDYAGQRIPEKIHGRSLWPLIEGKPVAWRDYAFAQRKHGIRMLRTQEFKYVTSPTRNIEALYDLKNDPHEDRNLAGEAARAATMGMMRKRLFEVMAADGDPQLGAYQLGAAKTGKIKRNKKG